MPKTIVLCCDGTNNQMTGNATNVLRLYRALVRDARQLTFYDPGVGTLADPMALTVSQKVVQRYLDAAIGRSLCQNFSDAYRFLSLHYQPEDEVCLFGFSRGAYAARAVAGAVHMLGLLRPELVHLTPYVWAIYANEGGAYDVHSRFGGAARFREMFCIPDVPRIRLLGLWDTVSSFGWFWSFHALPYTANNPSVEQVRHAVALDEHRVAFATNLFYEGGQPAASARIRQVWFPGVHSDVGGGYPDAEGALSKVAFEWMIQEVLDIGGVRLDLATVKEVLGSTGKYSPADPRADAHESLEGLWHLMEWLPRRQRQKVEDEGTHGDAQGPAGSASTSAAPRRGRRRLWVTRWAFPHLYRRRPIPPGSWIHPAVRQHQVGRKYDPRLLDGCVEVAYVPGDGYLP
jgi:uncharacterized protein (DUF2235 family)